MCGITVIVETQQQISLPEVQETWVDKVLHEKQEYAKTKKGSDAYKPTMSSSEQNPEEKDESIDLSLSLLDIDLEAHGELIGHRGPDSMNEMQVETENMDNMLLRFCSSVLHLRGKEVAVQPLVGDNGDVLAWNGELFDWIDNDGFDVLHENDGEALLHALEEADSKEGVISVLAALRGPFAFVYWQHDTQTLWFGRDVLGRRSLLWKLLDDGKGLMVTSVAPQHSLDNQWEELRPGLYTFQPQSSHEIAFTSWIQVAGDGHYLLGERKGPVELEYEDDQDEYNYLEMSVEEQMQFLDPASSLANETLQALSDAVGRRITCIPDPTGDDDARIAVLFSGGIDSMFLAALCDQFVSEVDSKNKVQFW
eukprot:TRINITY_DN15014_c0_g1_i1.p1 TRINITY_DN15014_c0_g1~~TRINITY_DN15014_c0_g1_i1.p1  ORF type:complete len:378 (+),score=89.43 TRINITY_DN15014_c0_g1_i1:37-1134(+)